MGSQNITDLDAVAKLLKSRAYRGDLLGENAIAFGNIDIKLFSKSITSTVEFRALAGPLYYNGHNAQTNTNNESKADKPNNNSSNISSQLEAVATAANEESLVNDKDLTEIDILSDRRLTRELSYGPFRWSMVDDDDVSHDGHPEVWNFDHVTPDWIWTYSI